MKTIVIKTQKEIDELPDSFSEHTVIEIRATERIYVKKAWENSSVEAWGNSSVVARENSSVVAWENSSVVAYGNSSVVARENSSVVARENSSVVAYGNSSVVAFQFAVVFAFSYLTLRLFDWACVRSKYKGQKFEINGKNVVQINDFEAEEISFDTWLERGYVNADGIIQKLIDRTKDGEIEIFKVADFKKKESFVVRKGDKFAHGDTLVEAKADLEFKINGSDTSRFKKWKKDELKPVGEMIVAYRAITGACSKGVRDFIKTVPNLPEAVSPEMVIGLIGDSYGAVEFKEFFK